MPSNNDDLEKSNTEIINIIEKHKNDFIFEIEYILLNYTENFKALIEKEIKGIINQIRHSNIETINSSIGTQILNLKELDFLGKQGKKILIKTLSSILKTTF